MATVVQLLNFRLLPAIAAFLLVGCQLRIKRDPRRALPNGALHRTRYARRQIRELDANSALVLLARALKVGADDGRAEHSNGR
jgi:hypothetical protein